jgi:non-specific serine/threonine protein kinase
MPFRYQFGTAEFDPQRLALRVDGALAEVQRRPLEILALLLANAGRIVTRDQILESVWNNRPIVDNVVASAITKLRSALGPQNAAFIITHPRVGYRLNAEVHHIATPVEDFSRKLEPGQPVPFRNNFLLSTRMDSGSGNDVWTAQHVSTSEIRVYKLCSSVEALGALRREAALLQLLRQDLGERADIAHVVDWNFDDVPYFIGYDFAGVDLATWADANGRLALESREARVDVFLSIAQSVAAVHRAGVIHQDLKPSNILLSPRRDAGWHVRLTDFGSGRLMQSERLARFRITQFGLLNAEALTSCSSSATPIYVAPELVAGQSATEQSDVYALGVLLYQLLVGDLRRPLASGWERNIDDELLREDIAQATDCDASRRFANAAVLCERLAGLQARRDERDRNERDLLAANVAREAALYRRARRGWMLTTCLLAAIAVAQGALLVHEWFGSK